MAASARATRPQFSSVTCAAWSYHSNTCAGIGNDFRVHFLSSAGVDQVEYRITRGQRAVVLAWSVANSLAIGWSDGSLTVWHDGTAVEGEAHRRAPVTHVCWHPTLPIVATACRNGDLTLWATDSGLRLLAYHETDISVTCLAFRPGDSPAAFAGSRDGAIFSFSADSPPVRAATVNAPARFLRFTSAGERLISVSGDNVLTQFDDGLKRVSQDGLEVGDDFLFTEIDDDSLCFAINSTIYFTALDLSAEVRLAVADGDQIVGLQFYSVTKELAAMTVSGRVVVWKLLPEKRSFAVLRRLESGIQTKRSFWSPFSKIALAIANDDSYSVCTVPVVRCVSSHDVVVLQTDTKTLSLTGSHRERFVFNIERLAASGTLLLVASDHGCKVLSLGHGTLTGLSEFEIPSPLVEILGENVFVVHGKELQVRNTSGEVRHAIQVESNSAISHLALNGKYLCLGGHDSLSLQLFLFDVSRRLPRLLSTSVFSVKNRIYRVRSIAVSRGGYCVSVALDFFRAGKWENSPKLFLHSPQQATTVALSLDAGVPLNHCWDSISASILCVQTATAVVPFFVDPSLSTTQLRPVPISADRAMFRVEVPRVFHVTEASRGSPLSVDNSVSASLMAQFTTLDGVDPPVRRILIELLFAILSENRDYARQIVDGMGDEAIVRPAMRFLLSTNEIELAQLCAAKLNVEEVPATASFLERAAPGDYEEVGKLCVPTDKLNVRANQYLCGLLAESLDDIDKASEFFEKVDVRASELLRMAMHHGSLAQVFRVAASGFADPQLHFWIGRFYEYHEHFDIALSHYDLCGDLRESIRLLCLLGRYEEVTRRVNDTDQKSAICCYARLLSKHHASIRDLKERRSIGKQVIELFVRAGQHGPAFDFAFREKMLDELAVLALQAPRPLVAKAARHFEEASDVRVAALLWHRAGRMNKALQMCLDKDAPDVLEEIADSVQPGADPAVLERCAEVLVDNGQFQRAAYFLALAGQFDQARELCQERKLKLPHQVIETLAQMKSDAETTRQVAALCEQQEAWLSAAQLYIAVGDHLAAMRNIIAQGDTDKVIRLAGLLKRKDAFLGAADYLASTRPREGQPLFRTTVQLYQKAGAFDKIAEFLVATAQNEIDEDQNYEKAAALLRRAHQTMARTEMTRERERLVEQVLQKIRWIELYLEATRCVRTDPLRMQSICNELLQTRGIEKCLRIEDVYMLLVHYAIAKENWVVAHRILDNMRMNGIDLKYVMDEEEIAKIFKAAGQVYVPKEEQVEDAVSEIPDDVVDMVADDF